MPRLSRLISLALPLVVSLGCESSTVCATLPAPALRITVVDSITQAVPIAVSTLTVQDGTYREVASDSDAQRGAPYEFQVGNGRPGTYAVLIETPGYQDWRTADVVVRAGRCGPEAVSLRANLQPD